MHSFVLGFCHIYWSLYILSDVAFGKLPMVDYGGYGGNRLFLSMFTSSCKGIFSDIVEYLSTVY